jgi:hypothetical protein
MLLVPAALIPRNSRDLRRKSATCPLVTRDDERSDETGLNLSQGFFAFGCAALIFIWYMLLVPARASAARLGTGLEKPVPRRAAEARAGTRSMYQMKMRAAQPNAKKPWS